jgi:hypothetical protein
MKRILTILALVGLVVGGITVPAYSADTGVVSVTAEVAQISVFVTPDNVNYGLVPMNTMGLKPIDDPEIYVYNNGNCFVDMFIRGADTTNWALKTTHGVDEYVHYFGQGIPAPVYIPLTLLDQNLGYWTSYSPSPFAAESFWLQMDTPTSSAATGTQSTSVTVMVTFEENGIRLNVTPDQDPYPNGDGPAILTATVTDQNGNPVEGIPSGDFSTYLYGVGPQTITWTETDSGVYTGELDISTLTGYGWTLNISTHSDSSFTSGWAIINIAP